MIPRGSVVDVGDCSELSKHTSGFMEAFITSPVEYTFEKVNNLIFQIC